MNWGHIRAVFDTRDTNFYYCDVAGRTIASQGHFAVAWPHPLPERAKQLAQCGNLWEKMRVAPIELANIGNIFPCGDNFYRQIGGDYIDEAYFRCLHEDGMLWCAPADKDSPVRMLNYDRALLAIVMPVYFDSDGREPIAIPPTDEEVFRKFDRYLAGPKNLLNKIRDLRREIGDNENQIAILAVENEELEDEIREIELQLEELKAIAQSTTNG